MIADFLMNRSSIKVMLLRCPIDVYLEFIQNFPLYRFRNYSTYSYHQEVEHFELRKKEILFRGTDHSSIR